MLASLSRDFSAVASRGLAALLPFVQPLLWLAACSTSAILVYWLYFDPVYRDEWSACIGAPLFALICVYTAVSSVISCLDAVSSLRASAARLSRRHAATALMLWKR